jgi:hypothetical protein
MGYRGLLEVKGGVSAAVLDARPESRLKLRNLPFLFYSLPLRYLPDRGGLRRSHCGVVRIRMVGGWDAGARFGLRQRTYPWCVSWHMFKRTRPLMLEVYDREKTAALLKKAREITAGLKSEIGDIASQISRVLDGREEDADGIVGIGTPSISHPRQ